MATEFHFFPLLPFEIRVMIWKLAIRPPLPGAHVFRVDHHDDSESADLDHEAPEWCIGWCGWSPALAHLAAPRCLPMGAGFDPAAQAAVPISWTLNNPSAYLIDSGLWTACKESSLVIEADFQSPARGGRIWSPEEVTSFRKERCSRFNLLETATYRATENSRCRILTVFPNQDLFILQPRNITALDWGLVVESFPSWKYSLGKWLHSGHNDNEVGCERHLALEYNPAWDQVWARDDGRNTVVKFIQDLACGTGRADHPFFLWFVDYRIKRRPRYQKLDEERTAGPSDDPPKIFYAKDRRFVQVKSHQMWHVNTGHDDAGFGTGPFAFVQALVDELYIYWDNDETRSCSRGYSDCARVEYGLLACEDL